MDNPIKNYTFFAYHKEEALHLSQRETAKVTCCLENIEDELHHAIDTHSGTILSRHIELLLDYCTRYYERQFITRENKNKAILEKLERLLDEYIISGKLENGQLPTAEYCTAELDLSVAYFNDLLRFETGKTLEEIYEKTAQDTWFTASEAVDYGLADTIIKTTETKSTTKSSEEKGDQNND